MREIKFRVWDNVDYMSNPFTLMDIQEGKIQFTSDVSIMQFVGMGDIEGKDMYEKDFVEMDARTRLGEKIRVVKMVAIDCGIPMLSNGGKNYRKKDNLLFPQLIHETNIRVIGNFFENPELHPKKNMKNKTTK